jgi:hypothetical protein
MIQKNQQLNSVDIHTHTNEKTCHESAGLFHFCHLLEVLHFIAK